MINFEIFESNPNFYLPVEIKVCATLVNHLLFIIYKNKFVYESESESRVNFYDGSPGKILQAVVSVLCSVLTGILGDKQGNLDPTIILCDILM